MKAKPAGCRTEVCQPKLSCEAQEEYQSLPFSGKDQIMTDISFSGGENKDYLGFTLCLLIYWCDVNVYDAPFGQQERSDCAFWQIMGSEPPQGKLTGNSKVTIMLKLLNNPQGLQLSEITIMGANRALTKAMGKAFRPTEAD